MSVELNRNHVNMKSNRNHPRPVKSPEIKITPQTMARHRSTETVERPIMDEMYASRSFPNSIIAAWYTPADSDRVANMPSTVAQELYRTTSPYSLVDSRRVNIGLARKSSGLLTYSEAPNQS